MYGMKKPLAWISPTRTSITLGFRQGAYFEDRYGLLKGRGKHARNVRMKTLKDVNKTALRSYIKQAVEVDKR